MSQRRRHRVDELSVRAVRVRRRQQRRRQAYGVRQLPVRRQRRRSDVTHDDRDGVVDGGDVDRDGLRGAVERRRVGEDVEPPVHAVGDGHREAVRDGVRPVVPVSDAVLVDVALRERRDVVVVERQRAVRRATRHREDDAVRGRVAVHRAQLERRDDRDATLAHAERRVDDKGGASVIDGRQREDKRPAHVVHAIADDELEAVRQRLVVERVLIPDHPPGKLQLGEAGEDGVRTAGGREAATRRRPRHRERQRGVGAVGVRRAQQVGGEHHWAVLSQRRPAAHHHRVVAVDAGHRHLEPLSQQHVMTVGDVEDDDVHLRVVAAVVSVPHCAGRQLRLREVRPASQVRRDAARGRHALHIPVLRQDA